VIIVENIAIRKPVIERRINVFPLHLIIVLLTIPPKYKIHTSPDPMSLGSRYEKVGNASGSQIIPMIIETVSVTNPITAE